MAGMNAAAFAIFPSRDEAETAVNELTAAGFSRQDVSVLTLASVHCDSSEEVWRAKDILKEAGGEDVSSAGEKSVSRHTGEKSVTSHAGERSANSPDTINAYRSKEPRSESPEGAAAEDEILDDETRFTRTRRVG